MTNTAEQSHSNDFNVKLTPINDGLEVNLSIGMMLKGTHTDATMFPHSVMSSNCVGFEVLIRADASAGTRAIRRQNNKRQ